MFLQTLGTEDKFFFTSWFFSPREFQEILPRVQLKRTQVKQAIKNSSSFKIGDLKKL